MLAKGRGRAEWSETGSKNKQAYEGIVNIDEDSLALFGQPFLKSRLWIQPHLRFESWENFSTARPTCPPGTPRLQLCEEMYCVQGAQVIVVGG